MGMTVDVVRSTQVIHVKTSGDTLLSSFMRDFAHAVALFEEVTTPLRLDSAKCTLIASRWECDYQITEHRFIKYTIDFSVVPHLVKIQAPFFFSEEERFLVERLHQEIEHLRTTHTLAAFEWTNA